MSKKSFWLGFFLILAFAFFLRIIPTQGNNFFFTMDQGESAVYSREILERGQILLRGAPTGVSGVFGEPGWYYFISIGYWLFHGDPFGALFMVTLLSIAATAVLMWQIAKKVSVTLAMLVGTSLQFFWFFYDTSRWAFDPFPLVILSVWLIFLLVVFLETGKTRYYALGLLPIALSFNTEIAGAGAFLLFYLTFGLWASFTWRLSWKAWVSCLAAILIFISPILRQLSMIFFKSGNFYESTGEVGVFSGTNFVGMLSKFGEIIQNSIVPQSLPISILLVFLVLLYFVKRPSRNSFKKHFIFLSIGLFVVSYLWFSTNKGWKDWHTIFLPTLLFVSFLLALSNLPRKLAAIIFLIVMVSQFAVFNERYRQYSKPSDDPSILANELLAIDWIYQKAERQGFIVYTYMDSIYDYQYQYLFWWYGRKKYGYVPCEYAHKPQALKYLYIPGSDFYSRPTLGCNKLQFLIIEPDLDLARRTEWLDTVLEGTKLLEGSYIGKIKVEMHEDNLGEDRILKFLR